jgi:NADP-dependent 3-hydroxy acid dehydrogenase YdfG
MTRTAVITGASAGIGAATARHLAEAGFHVVLGARRVDRIEALAAEVGGTAHVLDVTDTSSVEAFCAAVESCEVLVNNAGGALGVDSIADADEEGWRWMYDANVLGLMRMTRALLPKLIASGDGHVVNIVSIAGFESYPGGGGYVAAKHAARGVTGVLRAELLGQPVRVTELDPGLVETEFSVVRLGRDDANEQVYAGMTPLTADDVADVIRFAVTRPSHVNLDRIVLQPRDQASARFIHREV